jgi:hypothetical protein
MKLILSVFLLFPGVLYASTGLTKKVTVAYFGRISDAEFNEKLKPVFVETAQCKDCEIVNWTPYDLENKYDQKKLGEKIDQLDSTSQIVFFDWNVKPTDLDETLIEKLRAFRAKQQVIVASAGAPAPDGKTCPLNMTLFGKVDDAIIVGELIQRDILWPKCYFGPEMLTAVRPPKDLIGKGLGPLIFTAKFAANYNRRSSEEWTQYFRTKKAKSKKIWPELEDFFPRLK